jgi:hypothetical protein
MKPSSTPPAAATWPWADPETMEWGPRPPLKVLNFSRIYLYLKEQISNYINLYKKRPPVTWFAPTHTLVWVRPWPDRPDLANALLLARKQYLSLFLPPDLTQWSRFSRRRRTWQNPIDRWKVSGIQPAGQKKRPYTQLAAIPSSATPWQGLPADLAGSVA